MLKRFTREAREVVVRSQEHARRLGHHSVGCEHLLVAAAESSTPTGALLREHGVRPEALEEAIGAVIGLGPGPANNDDKVVLATLGIDLDEVSRAVEASFGPYALELARTHRPPRGWNRVRLRRHAAGATSPWRPFTPKAKRALELALRESLRLKHDNVSVEHIALALLGRDDTAAWKVLLHVGAMPGELRRAIERAHRRPA